MSLTLATRAFATDTPPVAPVQDLKAARTALLEAVAFGRDDEVVVEGRRVLDTEARHAPGPDTDGRERSLSDICWFVVRALLHRGDEQAARTQGEACAARWPTEPLSPAVHPPNIVELAASLAPKPVPPEPPRAAEKPVPAVAERSVPVVAKVGAVTGVALMVASWAAFARYEALDSRLHELRNDAPDTAATTSSRRTFSTLAWSASLAGSALWIASSPFVLPEAHGIPAWSWPVGVVGLGLAGVGIGLASTKPGSDPVPCEPNNECVLLGSRVPLAPLLISQGAALLSVPIVYGLRGADDEVRDAVALGASADGVLLRWSRRY